MAVLQLERLGSQLVQVEAELTEQMEKHSKEVDSYMAAGRSTSEEHLQVYSLRVAFLWVGLCP